jgi:hypothetical protein
MLGLTADEKDALVAFLNALTDDRARTQQAPFDHPELLVPDGERGDTTPVTTDASGTAADDFFQVPAVGAAGGPPLAPFPTPHSSTSAPPFDSEPVGSPAPAAVDFDSVARGQTANAQVVITSIGAQPLAVSKVRIDGARAAEFSLVPATRALGPRCQGSTCTVTVRFRPRVAGSRSAQLVVVDDAIDSPLVIDLAGAGS